MSARVLQPTRLGRAWDFIREAEASGRVRRGKCGADIASLLADFAAAEAGKKLESELGNSHDPRNI